MKDGRRGCRSQGSNGSRKVERGRKETERPREAEHRNGSQLGDGDVYDDTQREPLCSAVFSF